MVTRFILIDEKRNADGSVILTYSLVLVEEMPTASINPPKPNSITK